MLKQFFAVTISGSLYEISDEIRENGWPTIKKLLGPASSSVKVGSCMNNGRLVGISDLGICLFDPTPKVEREFEKLNISYWGGTTSSIVGLFLERASAETCLTFGDRIMFNDKYMDKTRATLQEIGNDHLLFVIGQSVARICSL